MYSKVAVGSVKKMIQACANKYIASQKCGLDLTLLKSGQNIEKDNILLFCTLRNEAIRIPFFLEYYRKLGINHFFFVDNGSTDNFLEIVSDQKDVTVYYTNASYKESAFGMYWLNFLLWKHGVDHWCVTCDPDEFFIFPNIEKENIKSLTNYLENKGKNSFSTILIDMYSQEDLAYKTGQNPLEFCGYFDKSGYRFTPFPPCENIWIQGGVRERLFCLDEPEKSPALNKVPLVYWKRNYLYASSTHDLLPKKLNHCSFALKTGALLHFKFLSTFKEKVKEEMVRGEHYNDSGEYKHYHDNLDSLSFYNDALSVKYTNSQQLTDLNLIKNDKP